MCQLKKKRQSPFKKTALSCTNTPQSHDVLEMYFLLFAAFLMDKDLVPGPKTIVSNSVMASVLTSALLLTWGRACPCSLAVLSVGPDHVCET